MAINATDWTITRADGNIRYTGGDHGAAPTYATVIEFHRWLQGLADDASSGASDDQLDITDEDPSRRSTDNIITLLGIYNIDDNAAEHLYDGSIIQGTGGSEVYYDGIVNFGNAAMQIQIHQDGAVVTDDWWNQAGAGLNADSAAGISHRFMIKTRSAGADIDGRRLLGTARRFGFTFSEFSINGTARGNNVLALSDSTDLNNQTAEGTVSGWTGITNTTEGYANIDVNNDSTDEYYYSEWNTTQPTLDINDFYERMKWLTRDSSVSTLYGISGELFRGVTHEIAVDGITSGPLNAFEELSWDGGASTGQMFAVDSVSAPTTVWIQLLKGVAPTDGETLTGGTSSATVDVAVTVTSRPLSTPFVGQSTGSALIGAYGVGVEGTDLTNTDSVTALDATVYNPPNYVTFSVGGLISGEDRVLVAPWDGSTTDNEGNPAIDADQLSLDTTLVGGTETAVVVTTTIPVDTPSAGDIRVQLDSGEYREVAYNSWTAPSTFNITSSDWADPDDATAGNNVWIAYIDVLAGSPTETFTSVYDVSRDLVVVVRDGDSTPIKQFISSAALGSGGGSVTAIRTSDT